MIGSRGMLVSNIIYTVLCLTISIISIAMIFSEFDTLPESDIWRAHNCTVTNNRDNFYEVNVNEIGQLKLCALGNKEENITQVKCYVPPLPVMYDQCSSYTPIQNLILLEDEDKEVKRLLEGHMISYVSAWSAGLIAIICFFWLCYSSWFVWCGCKEEGYWRCGKKKRSSQLPQGEEHYQEEHDHFRINLPPEEPFYTSISVS